jgi:hypothetical protein
VEKDFYMISKIGKEELENIKMIYHNVYFAYSDHEYLSTHGLNIIKAAFIDQNQTFFNRIRYYLFHFTIIELNKVFNNPETYSLSKYINNELKTSSTNDPLRERLEELKDRIKLQSTKEKLKNIKIIRDRVSAHLDSDREELGDIKILVLDIKALLDILGEFVYIFTMIVEDKEYVNPISKEILGYKLHKQYAKSIEKK